MNSYYPGEVLVIHDEKRTDRMNTLVTELQNQGIYDFTIIPAVKTSTRGVENISQAHKNCVRYAQEKGWDKVLIMEDDIMFTHPLSFKKFMEIFDRLPEDWLLYLGGVYDGHMTEISQELATATEISGLHCYIISEKLYDRFLSAPVHINIDRWISGKKYGKTLCHVAYPMVAMQHDGFSDNVRRQTNYNENIKKRYKLWTLETGGNHSSKE